MPLAKPGEFTFVGDARLGESFTVVVGSGQLARQMTFHRPIGETDLARDAWVRTPTSEIAVLLSRASDEASAAYRRRVSAEVRRAVLAAVPHIGRRPNAANNQVEEWVLPAGSQEPAACAAEIQRFMGLARAAQKPENEWAAFAGPHVKTAEAAFKAELRSTTREAAAIAALAAGTPPVSRPVFRTRSGLAGTVDQVAVTAITGRSLASAQDAVLSAILAV